jgi:hypothetical protein
MTGWNRTENKNLVHPVIPSKLLGSVFSLSL